MLPMGAHQGESTPVPGNPVNRDFRADKPNMKRPTGIAGIRARDGRVYRSPMIDRRDDGIITYATGPNPNARLANAMLEQAVATLPDHAAPIAHSDRGRCCRWPEWIRICQKRGIIRSMSAKGCSPDDSAAEGFFGRVKTSGRLPRTPGTIHLPAGRGTRRHVHAPARPPTHQTIPGLEKSRTIQETTRAGGPDHLQENTRSPLPDFRL